MFRVFLVILSLISVETGSASAMTGDARAIEMARRMIERMGGAEIWSEANWIYTREDARYGSRPGKIDSEFWRRTDAPGESARLQGSNVDRSWAWNADGGWLKSGDNVRNLNTEDMLDRLGWRRGEIYIMYARFAREDPNLRFVWKSERSFRVLDAHDGSDLGLYGVDANGELTTWSFGFGDDAVEYVYGPLKRFGNVSLPAWGTLTNGEFRFFYTDVRLSSEAPDVDLKAPSPH